MGAAQRLWFIAIRKPCDRAVALAAGNLCLRGIVVCFEKQRRACGNLDLCDLSNPIDIEREAGRRLLAAANAIGAAPARSSAEPIGIERKAEPRLVFKPVPFGRVQSDARTVSNGPGYGFEPIEAACECPASVDLAKLG